MINTIKELKEARIKIRNSLAIIQPQINKIEKRERTRKNYRHQRHLIIIETMLINYKAELTHAINNYSKWIRTNEEINFLKN